MLAQPSPLSHSCSDWRRSSFEDSTVLGGSTPPRLSGNMRVTHCGVGHLTRLVRAVCMQRLRCNAKLCWVRPSMSCRSASLDGHCYIASRWVMSLVALEGRRTHTRPHCRRGCERYGIGCMFSKRAFVMMMQLNYSMLHTSIMHVWLERVRGASNCDRRTWRTMCRATGELGRYVHVWRGAPSAQARFPCKRRAR